ncbi:MAG TPA: AAA family ATPase [bacterium]|nr:AAA family ATPase [bacterium]
MYEEFYGLNRKPFSKTPDPGLLYLSPEHAEALARMEQAVDDRELMVLTGDIGCGKTTLSRALIDRLPDSVRPALIINPRLTPNQLLRTIARRLGVDEPRYFRADLVEQISDRLFDCYDQGTLPLIIIDEAQSIPSRETFEEVRLLTNFQLDDMNLMAIIMMGQPELARRLTHRVYEAFRQRVGLKYHLGPLDAAAVKDYVAFRLCMAGRDQELFTEDAIGLLAELSRGIPRWINNLAGAALLQGFSEEAGSITGRIIRDVARDLGLSEVRTPDQDEAAGPDLEPDQDPEYEGKHEAARR